MRDILFLAHRVPYPPNRGDKMRSYHMLRHVAARARVHLGAFADDAYDVAHAEALRPLVASLHVERRPRRLPAMVRGLARGRPLSVAAFASARMQRFVDARIAAGADAVFAFSGQMAQFVPAGFAGRFVMDFVDVDSAKFAAYARSRRGPLAWVHAREAALLARFERETAARADAALFVSEAEAALFRAGGAQGAIAALGNGIDLAAYDPATPPVARPDARPLMVFTGQMDYPPNVQAVCWFAAQVLPLLPGARFAIVGRKPARAVAALASADVIVTGAVADVRGWIAAADVVVAPLGIARGVQNKLLEAMAMAKPVVASPAAFEGLEVEPGRELIVAEGAEGQAAAIRALLDDPRRRAEIGAAARAAMERRYAWGPRLAPLDTLLGLETADRIAQAAE